MLGSSWVNKSFFKEEAGSGSEQGQQLLMSEKSQAVYYISSCHMLIDKALSSMGARRNFCRGGESPNKAPLKTKSPPPKKKNCAITVLRGSEACSLEKILTMVHPTTF